MKVSVVVATYNGARHLEEQLRTIAAQSRRPDEVVVSDDGSSDGSVQLARELLNECALPHAIIEGVNVGYARNFLRGITAATGDVIFLSDQDDHWLPMKIESALKRLGDNPGALVDISDQLVANEILEPTGRTTLGEIFRSGRSSNDFIHGCCTSFDARLKPLVMRMPAELAHDDWIHLIGHYLDGRIVSPQVGQVYRRHSAALTRSGKANPTVRQTPFRAFARLRRSRGEVALLVASLDKKLMWRQALVTALDAEDVTSIPAWQVGAAQRRLERDIETLRERLALLTGGPVRRLRLIGRMIRGDYGFVGGMKSGLRDLWSPTVSAQSRIE